MKTQTLLLLLLAAGGYLLYKKKNATPLLPPTGNGITDATPTNQTTSNTADPNRFNFS